MLILPFLIAMTPINIGAEPSKIIKEEKIDILKIQKIYFSGHTYIHFINVWSYAGNQLIHDPDCSCVKDALVKILEKSSK